MSNAAIIGGPHTHEGASVGHTMSMVVLALAPAVAFGIHLYGWPALNLLVVTVLSAVISEAACLGVGGKPLRLNLSDSSAALAGLLLGLTLPPWSPWWIGVIGGVFAMVVGKHVFGGLGQKLLES